MKTALVQARIDERLFLQFQDKLRKIAIQMTRNAGKASGFQLSEAIRSAVAHMLAMTDDELARWLLKGLHAENDLINRLDAEMIDEMHRKLEISQLVIRALGEGLLPADYTTKRNDKLDEFTAAALKPYFAGTADREWLDEAMKVIYENQKIKVTFGDDEAEVKLF